MLFVKRIQDKNSSRFFAPSAIYCNEQKARRRELISTGNIELSDKEFRRLLDLIYIGDWILNSTRGDDRFEDYDLLQEKFFALAGKNGMKALVESYMGHYFPSKAYEEGGIHEAIADYEDAVFFDILAEELARRDMLEENVNQEDMNELTARMNDYMDEFEKNGVDRLTVDER